MYDLSPHPVILLDLDGTLFKEEHPLPGAVDLITRFNQTNRRYACLSNHSFSSLRIAQRLHRMGCDIPADHIYTACDASVDYVLKNFGPRPRLFNLATESFQELLADRADFVNSPTDPCDVVVNSSPISVYATPDRQQIALELLRRGAKLLGMCADRTYPSPRGLELGVGALTHMLAYAANVPPLFTGKPQPIFFQNLCQRLNVSPADCLLIGDNLESDIAGAKSVQMPSLLVLTGVTRAEDLPQVPVHLAPDATIQSLLDLKL